MGVPDEMNGPPLKRSRLCLRTSQTTKKSEGKDNLQDSPVTREKPGAAAHSSPLLMNKLSESTNDCIDLTADLPSASDTLVPPVASLYNLGNTCYLNCMLQVLRYTPGFLSSLDLLQTEIRKEEEEQKLKLESDVELSEEETISAQQKAVWEVVKNTHALYEDMSHREENYDFVATSDGTSMAARPSLLLDNIRELNPMFEGHFQHDAQELLRCFLCYMEDAERDLLTAQQKNKKGSELLLLDSDVSASGDEKSSDVKTTARTCSTKQEELALKGGDSKEVSRQNGKNISVKSASGKFMEKFLKGSCESKTGKPKQSAILETVTEAVKSEGDSCEEKDLKKDSGVKKNAQERKGVKRKRSQPDSEDVEANSESAKRKNTCPKCSQHSGVESGVAKKRGRGRPRLHFECTCKRVTEHSCSEDKSTVDPSCDSSVPNTLPADSEHTGTADGDSFLQKLQKRLNLSPSKRKASGACSSSTTASSNIVTVSSGNKPTVSGSQRSILSMFPVKQIRRLGTTGRIMFGSVMGKKSEETVSENTDLDLTETQEKEGDDQNSVKLEDSENPGCFDMQSDFTCKDLRSNESCNSPSKVTSLSLTYHGTSPKKPVTPKSTLTLTPGSPLTVPHNEEILQETVPVRSADDNSDVVRRTRNSPHPPQADSPSQVFPSSSSCKRNLTEQLLRDSLTTPPQTPSSPAREELKNATLHSPFKGGSAIVPVDFKAEVLNESPHKLEVSIPSDTPALSKAATLSSVPFKLETKSSSAPSSPTHRGLHYNRFSRSFAPMSPQQGISNSRSVGKCLSEIKLELQKCDWLGVSPQKSVSAKKALSVMKLRDDPLSNHFLCHEVPSPRRKIMFDENDLRKRLLGSDLTKQELNSSASSKVEPLSAATQSKSDSSVKPLLRSENQTTECIESPQSQSKSTLSKTSPVKKLSTPLSLKRPMTCLQPLSISLMRCDDLLLAAQNGNSVNVKVFSSMDKKTKLTPGRSKKSPRFNVTCKKMVPKLETSKHTLVEQLFGGTMMHITKCLVCEQSRERKEAFMDISVPVRALDDGQESSDDEDGTSSQGAEQGSGDASRVLKKEKESKDMSCLSKLMQAFSSIERLKGNNKYLCEQCVHYVEAERSCHYTNLPNMLTLHLKRFSATSGLFGGVSKLNDRITIPQRLPCLQYGCKPECDEPSHQYVLYAIVTHSGLSLLHGHYRSYVKVQPAVTPRVHSLLATSKGKRDPVTAMEIETENGGSQNEKSDSNTGAEFDFYERCSPVSETEPIKPVDCDSKVAPTSSRHSKLSLSKVKNDNNSAPCDSPSKGGKMLSPNSNLCKKGEKDVDNSDHSQVELLDSACGFSGRNISEPEYSTCDWLECDDECIRVIKEEDFVEKLEETNGALMGTPYVLFYHRKTLL